MPLSVNGRISKRYLHRFNASQDYKTLPIRQNRRAGVYSRRFERFRLHRTAGHKALPYKTDCRSARTHKVIGTKKNPYLTWTADFLFERTLRGASPSSFHDEARNIIIIPHPEPLVKCIYELRFNFSPLHKKSL